MTPPAWCFLCPLSPAPLVSPAQVTGVIFHQGTGPVPALNVSSGVATGGEKGHHGFHYPKPSSFQQQSEKYPGALIFMEVIISPGVSPRLFFLYFFPLCSPFLFLLVSWGGLVGWLVCIFEEGVVYLGWVGFGRQGLNTPSPNHAGAGEEPTPDLHRLLQRGWYQLCHLPHPQQTSLARSKIILHRHPYISF